MMLAEAEAKTKWCPFARVVPVVSPVGAGQPAIGLGVAAHNRIREPGHINDATWNAAMHCLGSACMAWRWHAWRCGEGCGTVRMGTIEKDKYEPCSEPDQSKYYDHIGYCGLAGQP
jgi:hypothetical protein